MERQKKGRRERNERRENGTRKRKRDERTRRDEKERKNKRYEQFKKKMSKCFMQWIKIGMINMNNYCKVCNPNTLI